MRDQPPAVGMTPAALPPKIGAVCRASVISRAGAGPAVSARVCRMRVSSRPTACASGARDNGRISRSIEQLRRLFELCLAAMNAMGDTLHAGVER